MLVERDLGSFEALADRWDPLALLGGSPYLTSAWLASWWRAFGGDGRCVAFTLHGDDDALLAGGVFVREDERALAAATNQETSDWDVVAADDGARGRFWAELGGRGWRQLTLRRVPSEVAAADTTRDALASAGYKLSESADLASPRVTLPGSLDELLATRSSRHRSSVGRLRRRIEKEGEVVVRVTTTPGDQLARDLDTFLELEASGWKADEGTAIKSRPAWEALYRDFAARAAAGGWLRLHLLELDGRPVAGSYGCVFAGCGYGMKLGIDEELRRLSPGIVLNAELLRSSIEEGLDHFDFLGSPDSHKTAWTDELRRHAVIRAFRGPRTLPDRLWWRHARPALKRVRDSARSLRRR